jgi:hypothetical protein
MIAVGEACTERQRGVASFADAPARSSLQRDAAFLDEQKSATKKFRFYTQYVTAWINIE